MFKYILTAFLVFIFGIGNYSIGQNDSKFKAADYFKYKDYYRALQKYLEETKNDSNNNDEINMNIGICYLNVNDDRSKAIPYLEKVYENGNYKEDLLLYLGKAYLYAYRFDDASSIFKIYKNKVKSFTKKDKADFYIKSCENAKAIMKSPVNVTFENLGPTVNSPEPEFYPFITKDQSILYFTSTREKNRRKRKSSFGYYTADIYYSLPNKNGWDKALSIGNIINTIEDEQCVYVTPSGNNMIISVDNDTHFGDLFSSTPIKPGQFSKMALLDKVINSKKIELEGCITDDGNTMIFSSTRRKGYGETDLYITNKNADGTWGKAVNLGGNINTEFREAFPMYDKQNGILYFSSEGHLSMGGFDIFKSKFDSTTSTFGDAVNIGYPINTPYDEFQFSLAENQRDGYISAYRKEGLGDLDIYKLTFNDVKLKTDKKTERYDSIIYVYIKDTVKQVENIKNKLVYRIQIGVYQHEVPTDIFKKLGGVYKEPYNEATKYFVGAFSEFENAVHAKEYIKSLGYSDAFIVPYNDNKRITIKEALELQKQ